MSNFTPTRECTEKLWVGTPFPVSHTVWDFFVLSIFPPFDQTFDGGRGYQAYSSYRFVNRWDNVAQIADGQYGDYWIHAYLPDDARQGTGISDVGVIIVPGLQHFYLCAISYELTTQDGELAGRLAGMREEEQETLRTLFGLYKESTQADHESVDDFRRDVVNRLGRNDLMRGETCTCTRGSLPDFLYTPENTLRHHTGLEFSRQLDSALEGIPDASRASVDEVTRRMHERYAHLLN